jgi:hypothetical protein
MYPTFFSVSFSLNDHALDVVRCKTPDFIRDSDRLRLSGSLVASRYLH